MDVSRFYLVFLLWLTFSFHLSAQNPAEKKVSIHFENVSLQEALQAINALPNITLSYNPESLPKRTEISHDYVNVSIDTVLRDLLGTDYQIKHIGQYVIIQKAPSKKQEKQSLILKGDIKDAETGQTLTDVTVYEVSTLNSTLSDKSGDFELKVKSRSEVTTFAISRKDYQDTIIQVQDIQSIHQDIVLRPSLAKEPSNREEDKWIQAKKLVKFFTTRSNRKNTENVQSVQDRYFQISFVPAVSTNMTMGGQVRHKLSFNVLAGYSYGLDNGFELGGLYNINRSDVSGVQIAGFGNTVGGETTGVQIGGVLNTSRRHVVGSQISGVANILTDSISGVQIAGVFNSSKKLDGTQISGFSNYASEVDGLQLSAVTNHTKELTGAQISSLGNTAQTTDGIQIGVAFNHSTEVKGVQISSLLNTTKRLEGVQLGIINYADSIGKESIQIGFINLGRKNSLFEFGVEYSDVIPWRVSLRTGTNKFYTALSAGTQLDSDEGSQLWSYGLGVGSKFFTKNRFFFNPEIHAHNLMFYNVSDYDYFNLLNKVYLNFGYQFFKHLSISGGPALNVYVSNYSNLETGEIGLDIAHNPLYDNKATGEDTLVQMWIGYQMSIRF